MPLWLRPGYMMVVNIFRDLGYYVLPGCVYNGIVKESGDPARLIYFGRDTRILEYYLHRFYSEWIREKELWLPSWRIKEYLKHNTVHGDLAIIENIRLTKKISMPALGFDVPRWFDMKLNPKKYLSLRTRKDTARRIRKYNLNYRIAESTDDFNLFYEKMYKPYIAERHKDAAIFSDFKDFLHAFRKKNSQLIFITQNNVPVAGSIVEYNKNMMKLTGVGVLNGSFEYLKMGVNAATYYYRIQECIDKNIETVHLGGASPIISDGLTQFKLSLGGEAVDANELGKISLWFCPLSTSVGLKNLLTQNPIVHRLGNKLVVSVFIDPKQFDEKSNLLKTIRRYKCSNTDHIIIHCFGNDEKIQKWLNEEELQPLQIVPFLPNNHK
jgi:hypothetical protein